MMRLGVLAILLVILGACVSVNKSVLSPSRMGQPVPQEEVMVYFSDDEIPEHERIALFHAEADSPRNRIKAIDKMRSEAGRLGANAVWIRNIEGASTAEQVATVLALGIASQIQRIEAVAIYVEGTSQ